MGNADDKGETKDKRGEALMKKDHIRDYATEAFRFYARSGGRDKYIKNLVEDLQRQKGTGACSPTEAALISKEEVIAGKTAELADIEAVDKVLHALDVCGHRAIIQAIEYVYFTDCWRDIERGDISSRVHHAELHIPASERQIYYWLAKARRMVAVERGLRL